MHNLNPEQFHSQADRKEAALDPSHPRHGQPLWGESSYHDTQRYVEGKNGKPYRIQENSDRIITAHPVGKEGNDVNRPPAGRRAGAMSVFGGKPRYDGSNIDGGVIHKVVVSGPHRRKGVATAMLEHARDRRPEQDVRHSSALTADGAAWAKATPTLNDLQFKRDT